MTTAFGRAIRSEWLLDDDIVFLNHGSYGATPRAVLAAQDEWRRRLERQPVRFIDRELAPALRAAGDALAHFVGAEPDSIVFLCNVTEGVNAVLRSLPLAPGDEIVATDHAYSGVANSLRHICAHSGARLVEAALPFPLTGAEPVVNAIDRPFTACTRLAVLDHVGSSIAAVMPIERLVARGRERGVPTLVDGAHAPGMLALRLARLGADYYVGNCHKWLYAPKGCAFLCARAEVRDALHPAVISTPYGQGYWAEFGWTGTRDPSAWLAVTAALDFFRGLGVDAARRYMHGLADWAGDMLARRWRTERGAPGSMTGAMVAVRVPGDSTATADEARRLHDHLLAAHRIEVPVLPLAGALWVRISAQVYNGEEDFERLAAALS